MQRASMTLHKTRPGLVRALFPGALALAIVMEAAATDPHIDLIERYGTNQATIHFNTDANRTYVLQYSSAKNFGTWSDLFTIPSAPFPNHFVLVARATNAFGFFRLAVTP